MKIKLFWIFIWVLLFTYIFIEITQNLSTERNTVSISLSDTSVSSSSLSVAVIGDVHLPEDIDYLDTFEKPNFRNKINTARFSSFRGRLHIRP